MLRRFDLTPARLIFLVALLAFLGLFFIYPLLHVLKSAFLVKTPDGDTRFTLEFALLLFRDGRYWNIVLNSVNVGLAVTLATTLLAVPLAYAMTRREFPGKGIMSGLLLVPMMLPPFVGAVGMRQMFARFGSINQLLMGAGIIDAPIDWFGGGMTGVIVMETLHLYPIMYLNVAAALANVDPSLEEAASNVGASSWKRFTRVTCPLMLPGYFAGATIVFIWAFTDLGAPLVFQYREVVPVQIFDMLSDIHENQMGYMLVVLLIVMTVGFFYLTKAAVGGKRYEMLARGHVGSGTPKASGPMTAAIYVGMLGLTFFALLPHMAVALSSLTDEWFMTVIPSAFTTEHYTGVFAHDLTSRSIRNSLMLSTASTFLDIVVGITVAYLLARTKIPGRNILDTLTMLPLAVPGLIIAFGYVGAFAGTALDPRENPFPLLICAYAVRRLPYMVRAAYAGFQQTSVSVEEAALNVGASPGRMLRRITLPLVFANLVAGGILCFAFAMLEVSDSLILASKEQYYPITKAIYELLNRPDGPYVASALGVLGMLLLATCLFVSGKFLGKRMGELFRV